MSCFNICDKLHQQKFSFQNIEAPKYDFCPKLKLFTWLNKCYISLEAVRGIKSIVALKVLVLCFRSGVCGLPFCQKTQVFHLTWCSTDLLLSQERSDTFLFILDQNYHFIRIEKEPNEIYLRINQVLNKTIKKVDQVWKCYNI